MTDFINFIKEYGIYILSAFSIIIEVFIILVKKNPKTLDDFLDCLHRVETLLPDMIIDVERPGSGTEKKEEVITRALFNMKHLLGRDLSKSEMAIFNKNVSDQIENVLASPTKKEDK